MENVRFNSHTHEKADFGSFTARDWFAYYTALNAEKPANECGLDLTPEERVRYEVSLERLLSERQKYPGVPITYEVKSSWFD